LPSCRPNIDIVRPLSLTSIAHKPPQCADAVRHQKRPTKALVNWHLSWMTYKNPVRIVGMLRFLRCGRFGLELHRLAPLCPSLSPHITSASHITHTHHHAHHHNTHICARSFFQNRHSHCARSSISFPLHSHITSLSAGANTHQSVSQPSLLYHSHHSLLSLLLHCRSFGHRAHRTKMGSYVVEWGPHNLSDPLPLLPLWPCSGM